jgi:CRISPR-associated protein Cmr2
VKSHLHLSIGPVQAFVAQSRRTRDLWSSSYLLSFLTAHAMRGVRKAGGIIKRPLVEDDQMLQWVEGRRSGEPPRFGSLPNQFTVELPQRADPKSIAEAAKQAFDDEWMRVSEAVWRRFVASIADSGQDTRRIWDRQVKGFWELMWVAGDPEDHGLLARRKLWRTHWLPVEPGDKCTLMPDFQELSGYVRATERKSQEHFWQTFAYRVSTADFDEAGKERLCAIALVKRLYADKAIVHETLGWGLEVTHWPSTIDVAAVPWIEKIIARAPAEAKAFASSVASAAGRSVLTGGARDLLDNADSNRAIAEFDANWFHRSFISNPNLARLIDETARKQLCNQLGRLTEGSQGPPIYFAMLLADGDNLGRLVSLLGPEIVSPALARFTRTAPPLVSQYHGATIYAGGDDLLAMLPAEAALECAGKIEQAYRDSFEEAAAGRHPVTAATLSAAVVFAHARAPLPLVLAEAHRVLDVVAKDANGRNSLGVSVYRAYQCAAQWRSTWRRSTAGDGEYDAVSCVNELANKLRSRSLSAAFLYRIGRTLAALCGSPAHAGSFAELPDSFTLPPFLRAELEQSSEHLESTADVDEVVQLLDRLLRRAMKGERISAHIGLDGLAVARFIAGGGCEEEHVQDQ